MPTLTINIAVAGTLLVNGKTSTAGHMWYSITDDQGVSESFGFAPIEEGQWRGPGDVNPHNITDWDDGPSSGHLAWPAAGPGGSAQLPGGARA